MSYKKIAITVMCIIVVIAFMCFIGYRLNGYDTQYKQLYLDFIAICGFVITVAGLYLTFEQAHNARKMAKNAETNSGEARDKAANAEAEAKRTSEIADEVRREMRNEIKRVDEMLTYADIAKAENIPEVILNHIGNKEYKQAGDNIKDLKDYLISLRSKQNSLTENDREQLRKYITSLDTRLKSFYKYNNEPYALSKTMNEIISIQTFLEMKVAGIKNDKIKSI